MADPDEVYEDFGQKVDLTARIREVLAAYPDGSSILKELIQNADDAGAGRVKVCLDRRTHSTEGLLFPKTATFQSRSLLVYNDSVFSERDFESIQQVGNSKKRGVWGKTGRFGIGFNSVYHLSDLPSFVSTSKVAFFDPHCKFLPSPSYTNPGKIVDFVKAPVADRYPSQFQPYEVFGCDMRKSFDGTLFRFPLRTEEQAVVSNLSTHAYTDAKVAALFDDFMQTADSTIIFLQHVEAVELYTWDDGQPQPIKIFESFVETPDRALRHQRAMLQALSSNRAGSGAMARYSLTMTTTRGDVQAKSTWRICQMMGAGAAGEMAAKAASDRLGLHLTPWAGVAALTSADRALEGQAYCFLPLPAFTGMPVHVNGFFELSNNRRDIWYGSDMAGDGKTRSDWNVALLCDVVAPAYVQLLLDAASELGWCGQYFQLWPRATGREPWAGVVRALYQLLFDAAVLRTELGGGKWIPPDVAVLSDESVDYSEELTQVMFRKGLPVVVPPAHIREMLGTAQSRDVCQLSPALVRRLLLQLTSSAAGERQPVGGAFGAAMSAREQRAVSLAQKQSDASLSRDECLLLLRYCLSDLRGSGLMYMQGLALIPTADGKAATFGPIDASTQVYTCGQLEYDLLLESQPSFLVDRSIPEDLYDILASTQLQESCNVRTLNPRTLARLFDMGTLPATWKRCPEVQWSGTGANVPSKEWVQLFWEYAEKNAADLECFEDWPLLPCDGGVLRRLIKESSVVDMGSAGAELGEVLMKLGCRSLDTTIVVAQPRALSAYVNPCTGDGVLAAVVSCAVELQDSCDHSSVAQEVSDLLVTVRQMGMDQVSAKHAADALSAARGDAQVALNWLFEHPASGDSAQPLPFDKLFERCADNSAQELRVFFAREFHEGRWPSVDDHQNTLQRLPVFEHYEDPAEEGSDEPQLVIVQLVDLSARYSLPPAGMNELLVNSAFLRAETPAEVSLLQKLGVQRMSESRFYRLHVFTRMATLNADARNSAMVTVLANLPRLRMEDPDFVGELTEVEFVPTASGALHRPKDLYDPKVTEAAELLGDDSCYPMDQFASPDLLAVLTALGLRSTLDRESVLRSAESVEKMSADPGKRDLAINRAKMLLRFLDRRWDDIYSTQLAEAQEKAAKAKGFFTSKAKTQEAQLNVQRETAAAMTFVHALRDIRWLPVVQQLPLENMPWRCTEDDIVASAKDVRMSSDMWLASASMFILDGDIRSPELREHFGVDAPLSGAVLTRQLKAYAAAHSVASGNDAWSQTMASAVPKLYEEIGRLVVGAGPLQEQALSVRASLEGEAWVWVGYAFVDASRVAFRGFANSQPYLHTVPSDLRSFNRLFKALGVRDSFSSKDYTIALESLANDYGGKPIGDENHLELAISILQHWADADEITVDPFVPDQFAVMTRASEMVFDDAPWIAEQGGATLGATTRFVHPRLSNYVSGCIGVKSLRAMMLASSSVELEGVEAFGQHESITARLKSILSLYPEGVQILTELLQNADDARASEVAFMFDPGTQGTSSLLHPEMALWQGPALYIYNDSTFSAADYRNLSQIGQGSKLEKMGATGRFGLGFNAVYHFTDVPSFVSGDHLVFFDPHCRFLPNTTPSHPGLKMKISDSKLAKLFPDQFKPYMHFGSTCEKRFDGTLFRFPLRSAEAAKMSEIKSKPCTAAEVQGLLASFKKDAANALLFLKHVTRITIHIMDEEGGTTEVFSAVDTQDNPETQEQQSRIPSFVCGHASNPMSKDEFYAQLQSTPERDLPVSIYEKRIVVTDGGAQEDSRWLISSAIGGGKARELALESIDGPYQLRLVPWAGVAARLSSPEEELVGRAYCFLPLPTMVGLPVHVNGSFELSSNRRDIWHGSDMTGEGQLRSEWNHALLHDVVAPAYARLLERASSVLDSEHYFRLWPTKIGAEPWVTLVRGLYSVGVNRPIMYTRLNGGRWLAPAEAILADTTVDNREELNRVLLLEGLPIVDPPIRIREMILTAQEHELKEMKPALARRLLREGDDHPALAERDNTLLLLRYCLSDLEGQRLLELDGLPLIPTADGHSGIFAKTETKSYKAERGKGLLYTCGQLEYDLLLESQPGFLVDRSIPEDLYAILAGTELQENCNIQALTAQAMSRLFDMGHGTLPATWKRCPEVQWSGTGANVPSKEWVQLFWEYAEKNAADLECFEDWPLLPCDGGVLRRLIKESSVVDMGSAGAELGEVLMKLGCRSLDTTIVVAQPRALSAYVNPCTASGVLKAAKAAGLLNASTLDVVSALSLEMKRVFRAFVGREYANGWRPADEELEILEALPIYEAYSVHKDHGTEVVDLLEKRWIPPQGAARELMDSRCLQLIQAEDASLYECMQISVASEPVFLSEFVFPLRLPELDEAQQDSTMLGVLRSLSRLQQAEPQFQAILSKVAFVSTASGVRRCPTDVYHPELTEIVAELLGADEHLPTGPFAETDILDACGELGLRRSVDRTTLLESAQSVATLPPADGLRRAQTLLSYLDSNFQALVKNSVGADAFRRELLQHCWLPVLVEPNTLCLPWPSEPLRNVARPGDARPQRDAWLVSSSMRLLDHKIQSAELEKFLGLSEPIPISVLTEQIVQLSQISRKMEGGWRTELRAEFSDHLSVWRDVLYDALVDYMFNDSLDQQAQFEAAVARLRAIPWFWTGAEWETPRFLNSFEMAFSGTLNDAELTDSAELAPYLYVIPPEKGDPSNGDYEDLFQRLGVQLSFEASDYMAVLERMELNFRSQPLPDREMQLAVKLVSELGDRVTEIVQGVVLVPDNSKVLIPAPQLLFNDANWLSLEGRDDLRVAHPDVSVDAAEKLGARSLRHMLAADSSISTATVACPSAADVKAALDTTQGCPSVLFDLLEVADMCGCQAASVVVDLRQHPSVSLLQPTLAQFQGPALCFFMPEVALTRYEIGELMRSHGAGYRGTTCRYGSGLLRGYELGEVVFVISGAKFSVFDPSGAYLLDDLNEDDGVHQVEATGKEYDYVASGLPKRFPDQFRPFSHYGFSGETSLPGTVVRIPLRTPNQAARSSIHSKPFSQDANVINFTPIVQQFYQCAVDTSLLLFAQHLNSVRFSTFRSDANGGVSSHVEREPEPEPENKGTVTEQTPVDCEPFELPRFFELGLVSPLAADRWAVLQEDWRPGFGSRFSKMFAGWKPPKQKLHLAFQFKNEHESHTDNWVVCSTLAAGDSRELAVDPQFRHLPALTPYGSVALHLARDGQTAVPVDGQDFCCFPVGRPTGLPVHVNGMFVLPRDNKLYHTNPTSDVNQRIQANWNTCVLSNVVESYCDALLEVQSSCVQENPGRLYKYWPQQEPIGNAKALIVDQLFRRLTEAPMFLTEQGKFDRLENGFIATEQVKPSVSKFVSENFQVFDLPQGISDALLNLQKTESVGGPLDVLRKFGPADLRQILRKRGAKLKQDPEVRDLSLACDLLEYCASDLIKSKNFSDIVGVRVLPLANTRLSVVGKTQIYTMASTKILELLPLPAETFVHEKCSKDLPELFRMQEFQKCARISLFGCAELTQHLGKVLPTQWRGARLVAMPSGALSGSQIDLRWLTQFWEYVNAAHGSVTGAETAPGHANNDDDDSNVAEQGAETSETAVADDQWEETMANFDSWPLIPLCNDQIVAVSCRHAVVMMPEELKGGALSEILLKLGCLMIHPSFASTGLFRYKANDSEPFVSTLINKLGQTLGRLNAAHSDLSVEEGEHMLQFLIEDGIEFTDTQKSELKRLPIFETCAGTDAQLVSLDVPGGRFIIPPSSCGGLFDPKEDSRFLKHKEQFLPLYLALGVQMLTEADVLGRFLLPRMDSADDKDRAEQIRFIRKNWDGKLCNNPQFVEQLKQASFVTVADGRTARAEELFHPEQPVLAQIFQDDPVFPAGEFRDPDWLAILEKLGLRQEIDATLFLHCAGRVHTAFSNSPPPDLDVDKMLHGATALAAHFTRNANQLATEPDFFAKISDMRFLPVPPVGMPDELTEGEDEQPVRHHSQRTASYSEVAVPRDWALVWSARPICPAELLPPQIFWTKLKIQTPPVVEHVLDHLSSLTPDVLERWAFPQSRQKAFDRIFEYLTDRLEDLPLPRLQATACIPVANTMVKPSRLFFHLSDELAPFLFEVPRCFGAYDKLFRAMGVREATDDAEALMSLLSELRQEFDGEPLNAGEMRTAIRILQRLSDSVKEEQWQLSWQLSDVPLPTAISTLEPAASLFFNDAPWILERIDSSSMRATHTLLPLHLASRFGVPKLSEVVVESADQTFEPTAVSCADAERWTRLLSSPDFADGVARVGRNHGVILEVPEVCRLLSPYQVRVVESIRTRFTHTSGRDVTQQGHGSQVFVDTAESVIYLADWPEYVRGEDLLAQAVSYALKQPTVFPLGPLLRCADGSSIAPLLDALHIADTAGEGRRGVAGTPVLPVDQELLQLRPLREYHHGEVVAWRADDNVMRYATVVSWKTETAADDSAPTSTGGAAAAAGGLLQRVELRVDDQENQVRSLLATQVFSFRSNRGRHRALVPTGDGRPRSFGSAAAVGVDSLYEPEPEPEPAAPRASNPTAVAASPRTTASRPVPAAEVSRAVRDLLAMLDVPVSLDQQQLLQAKLQMQEQLSEAQRELQALRGGLTTAEEELEKYKEAFTCQICMDRNANVALVRCGHRFCNECMHRLQESSQNQKCAYCRQTYTDTVPFFTGT